jgi:outer membrane murein-binding lipoprotein Lpp
MEGTVAAPPQRVCPKCARISWAAGPRCPYCRARFRRQSTGTIAWMIALAVVVILAGVALMLYIAGREVRNQLNDRSTQIEQRLDAQVNQIRQDLDNKLNALPSVTPIPTIAPVPSPSPSPSVTTTPAPTASPTRTPRRPTATPTIRP